MKVSLMDLFPQTRSSCNFFFPTHHIHLLLCNCTDCKFVFNKNKKYIFFDVGNAKIGVRHRKLTRYNVVPASF